MNDARYMVEKEWMEVTLIPGLKMYKSQQEWMEEIHTQLTPVCIEYQRVDENAKVHTAKECDGVDAVREVVEGGPGFLTVKVHKHG